MADNLETLTGLIQEISHTLQTGEFSEAETRIVANFLWKAGAILLEHLDEKVDLSSCGVEDDGFTTVYPALAPLDDEDTPKDLVQFHSSIDLPEG